MIARVPVTVLAGLMVTLGMALIDNWTKGLAGRLRRKGALRERALLWSVATVALVALTEVFFGFQLAIAVGFQLSGLLFYLGMNRSLVRSVVDGTVRPSRRIWGGEDAARVHAARQRIRVIELEGALFFGSAERLSERVEPLAGVADAVVLDFRRVTVIDATGALLIESIARRLATRGTMVLLAGVTAQGRHGATLVAHDTFRDAAVAAVVPRLRPGGGVGGARDPRSAGHTEYAAVPLSAFPLLEGIGRTQLARIAHHFVRREVRRRRSAVPGVRPRRPAVPARDGAVEISIVVPGGARARLVTMAEGSMFGDAALLDGRPRSATAQAVGDDARLRADARGARPDRGAGTCGRHPADDEPGARSCRSACARPTRSCASSRTRAASAVPRRIARTIVRGSGFRRILVEAAPGLAPQVSGGDHLLQQRRRAGISGR